MVSSTARSVAPGAAARRRAATAPLGRGADARAARRVGARARRAATRALRRGVAPRGARDGAAAAARPARRRCGSAARSLERSAAPRRAARRRRPRRRSAAGSSQCGLWGRRLPGPAAGHVAARSPRRGDERREVLAAMLEVPVLVEARAGRAEQHDVARHGGRGGVRDGGLEVGQHDEGRRPLPHRGAAPFEGFAQRGRRGADQDGLLDTPLGGRGQAGRTRRPSASRRGSGGPARSRRSAP